MLLGFPLWLNLGNGGQTGISWRKKKCQFIFPLRLSPANGYAFFMGHQPRPIADGLVYHTLNRRNNRAAVFSSPADHGAFLAALRKTKNRYRFREMAYVTQGRTWAGGDSLRRPILCHDLRNKPVR